MQRLRHLRAPGGVDPHPIAVERDFDAAFGAELRIGAPADIGELAGGVAQPRGGGRVAVEQRREPAVEQVAMFGKAARPMPFLARRDGQRILRAGGGV